MFKKSGRGFKKPFCINEKCSNFLPEDQRGYKKKTDAAKNAKTAEETEGKEEQSATKKTTAKKTTAKKTASTKKTAAKKTTAKKTTAAKKTSAAKKETEVTE